jgi:hypothetical protein
VKLEYPAPVVVLDIFKYPPVVVKVVMLFEFVVDVGLQYAWV